MVMQESSDDEFICPCLGLEYVLAIASYRKQVG